MEYNKEVIITEKKLSTNKVKRILLVVFAFLLFYLVSFLIDPYGEFWQEYFQRGIFEIIEELVISFIFCFLISESSIFIHSRLNKYVPWTKNKIKRLILELSLNFFVVLILIVLNSVCYYLIYDDPAYSQSEPSIEEIRNLLQFIIVSMIISFMIISINTGSYLINNWVNTETQVANHKLRTAEWKQASVEAELNALKLQLNPHFIFNNLSVLSELILEDQQLGYAYSENFSKVYRFLLVNSKKNMILLEEELKFLNSYIFLIKHRIGEGVHFEIDVQEESKNMYIPPLTLQLLIENALKHNKTDRKNPLRITIRTSTQHILTVENTLSLIEKPEGYSTGIGLTNIISRFNLLSKQPPEIVTSTDSFKVIIHLMEYDR
ncbi:sensor histidine kinase [Sphingobacterium spiritivorum]|uniref:sensor histidine kinase n=1 Tax=Sphingobacterium spiritivorum TaxID=258 RepID=UPI003DA396BD